MSNNEQHESGEVPSTAANGFELTTNNFELSNAIEPEFPSDWPRKRHRWRLRPNWYLMMTGAFLIALWWIYVYPMQRWEEVGSEWFAAKPKRLQFQHESPQREFIRTVQLLAVAWFFYFGACIGSFFNVVAWRWPNGRGIVFGGSKCPFCNNQLGFIHNTPIIGWMWCRGKCAFCKLPIATRYLWMEVAFGLAFAILVVREVVTGGANLPGWTLIQPAGFENTIFTPNWLLITAYLQHAFVFASIIMLIASTADGLRFPWWGWCVFVGLIAGPKLFVPELEFIPWWVGLEAIPRTATPLVPNLGTVVAGGLIGGLLATVCGVYLPRQEQCGGLRHWIMCGFLLGAVLGWQTVVFDLVLASLIVVVWPFQGKEVESRWTWCLVTLLAISYVTHIFWRQIGSMVFPYMA